MGALAEGAAQERENLEAKCLSAFDNSRASIQEIARAAYSRKRHNSYTLSAAKVR
jgi:hypothetical protein